MRKEDLASNLQVFPFHPSFSSEKKFLSLETKLFHALPLSFSTQSIIFQTSKLFIHQISMRPTDRLWITFTHFHPKLMKDISFFIETCFFMILHENFNLWIHVPNLSVLVKISLLHMKLTIGHA